MFQNFQKIGLQLDIYKYEFYVQETKYLNLIIMPKNIKINPKKIASVFDWPKFENFEIVQNFLNFVNFYKCFIWTISKHAIPLNALV